MGVGEHGGHCVRSARSASALSQLSEANTEKSRKRAGWGGAREASWGYRKDLCLFPPHITERYSKVTRWTPWPRNDTREHVAAG